MTLDSGLLFALLREIRNQVIGMRIRDILGQGPLGFVLDLHSKDAPQVTLVASLEPKSTAFYLRESPPKARGGSPFLTLLRQHLLQARLRDVIQIGFDRIAKITLVKSDELGFKKDYALILEFLGSRTNVFLLRGEDGRILGQMRPERTAARTLGIGKPYRPPPDTAPYDFLSLLRDQFFDLLQAEKGGMAAFLKRHIRGLSPQWAEEILFRASDQDPEKLYQAFEEIRTKLLGEPEPVVYLQEGKSHVISPFPLMQFRRLEHKAYRSLSQAFEASEAEAEGDGEAQPGPAFLREKLQAKLSQLEDPEHLKRQAEVLERHLKEVPANALEFTVQGVTVPLDAKSSPEENLQALYKRYRKAKQGRETLKAKIEALKKGAPTDEPKTARKGKTLPPPAWEPIYLASGEKIAPRRFTSPHGYLVLIGRTNHENDLLTLKLASPQDLFFHTRGTPGSHTILRGGPQKERPPKEDLLFAARLAAYFSKARQAKHVEVSYTERKHVTKPRGAKPGLVVITREKTLYVEPGLPKG